MTDSNLIRERHDEIQKWIVDINKYDIMERQDEHFHFSFFIWPKGSTKVIPLSINYLKEQYEGQDIIAIALGWNFDKNSDLVRDVLNDPEKTSLFVQDMRKIVDSTKCRISFQPNEQTLESVKISRLLPFESLFKELLFQEMMGVWIVYANISLHLELKSGRPNSLGL
jgi:hypothetical protein